MMKKRKRLVAALIALALVSSLSYCVAGNIDLLLTGHTKLFVCPVWSDFTRQGRILWLLLEAGGVLWVLWCLYGRSYLDYHSDMYEVVPGFAIPRPDGQGQHGTAWFMSTKDYQDHFGVADTSQALALTEELSLRYDEERRQILDGV